MTRFSRPNVVHPGEVVHPPTGIRPTADHDPDQVRPPTDRLVRMVLENRLRSDGRSRVEARELPHLAETLTRSACAVLGIVCDPEPGRALGLDS